MDKLTMTTGKLTQASIARIGQWFPHVLTEKLDEEGEATPAIDFDLLRQELSEVIVEGEHERYQLSWPGKQQALLQANSPTSSTLRANRAESVNWPETRNLYIEGDNLDALKLLQRAYDSRIKMIYIDPPYNTGNEYIYKDRFYSDWLSMMYTRLKLARGLLREDGVIFVSIDDHEQANLFKLLEELYGSSNFVAHIVWQKKYGPANDAKRISATHEHILMFAKNIARWKPGLLPRTAMQQAAFRNWDDDPRGPWRASDLSARKYNKNCDYPIIGPTGAVFYPPPSRAWIVTEQKYAALLADGRITFGKQGTGRPMQKKFLSEVKQGITPDTWWSREKVGDNKTARYELKKLLPENVFDTPKPSTLVRHMMKIANVGMDDIVLDFFSGSATTAHAVMAMNAGDHGRRSYILVQLPERTKPQSRAAQAGYSNICEIGKQRIKRAAQAIKLESGADIDYGFRLLHIEPGSTQGEQAEEDLLIQALLELGISLSLPLKVDEQSGIRIYQAGDGDNCLIACFAEKVPQAVVQYIAAQQPQIALFRDQVFVCDTAADAVFINKAHSGIASIFRLLSPLTQLKFL